MVAEPTGPAPTDRVASDPQIVAQRSAASDGVILAQLTALSAQIRSLAVHISAATAASSPRPDAILPPRTCADRARQAAARRVRHIVGANPCLSLSLAAGLGLILGAMILR